MRNSFPKKLIIIIIFSFNFLTACQQVYEEYPTPMPSPPPEIISISLDPVLNPIRSALVTCTSEQPNLSIVIAQDRKNTNTDQGIYIQAGNEIENPGELFIVALGTEQFVFAKNAKNDVNSLTRKEIQEIYSKSVNAWPDKKPIVAWIPAENTNEYQLLELVMEGVQPDPTIEIAPSPESMVQAITEYPNALGVLPAAWINNSAEQLTISGAGKNSISVPILAVTKSDPSYPIQQFLYCLQSGSGAKMLRKIYPNLSTTTP